MPKTALTVTTFVNADGTPVANGTLTIRLSQAGSVNDTQIQTNFTKIPLDSSGVITGSPTFWPNANILPAGSYYIRSVFTAKGQQVSGPSKITV